MSGTQDGILYQGEHIQVRRINRRNGSVCYGVHRPGKPNAIIDQFETLDEANLVAEFIDRRGGSYDARARKAAKEAARQKMEASTCTSK